MCSNCFLLVSIVVGVPTIKRERESYLDQTVQSLIESLDDDEKNDCLIVIMICEEGLSYQVETFITLCDVLLSK